MKTCPETCTRLLTEREAAERLGVSPGTLSNWRSARLVKLPFLRLGRTVRYRARDIERFLDSATVNPVQE